MVTLIVKDVVENVSLSITEGGDHVALYVTEQVTNVNLSVQDTGIADVENLPFAVDLVAIYQVSKL